MAFNFNSLKKYDSLLDLNHYSENERMKSLREIFDRDIANNNGFKFRGKIIRPLKIDGQPTLETLFKHLTYMAIEKRDKNGKKYKTRSYFDIKRSERLHWIWPHIQEKVPIKIFSVKDRVSGRNVIRTYIFNEEQNYVIVLEPYRRTADYYLLTAYYLEEKKGGAKRIKRKYKRKLEDIY